MAQEKPHCDGMEHKKASMHKKYDDEMLNLTDAQKEQMKTIRTDTQKQMMPLKNQLQEKEARMKTLTTNENVDMAQVDALIDEMAALRAEMRKIKERKKQETRSILTEEQRVIFDSMKAHHKGRHKGHKQGPKQEQAR